MEPAEFSRLIFNHFPFEPTKGQSNLIVAIARFCFNKTPQSCFILQGYAGTGKTTFVRSLIETLPAIQLKSVLLAPTGRAAKVLSSYSNKPAFTIHKKIYRMTQSADGGSRFSLQENTHTNTLFIVDEASMIGTGGGLTGSYGDQRSLLDDLISYVGSGQNCKLLLIGDVAQLPPIGSSLSPALDIEDLKRSYSLAIDTIELKDVVRQLGDSGILNNATLLRNILSDQTGLPEGIPDLLKFNLKGFHDIERLAGADLEDALNYAYSHSGVEGTAVICRSNKRANVFNQQIRARIRWQESELSSGDFMMVVKNNYHWLPPASTAGFIANGDTIELLKVGNIREMYGFRFATARIRLVDYPQEAPLEVNLLLDVIAAEAPSLTNEQQQLLYQRISEDYMDIGDKRKRLAEIKKNPYYNALQVKFAYAVTCHKAQGGQWETVFVDQGYLTKEMIDVSFVRWLYTALTRATKKLYLVNFNNDFFEESVIL